MEYFTAQRPNCDMVCQFPMHAILNDCSDLHARPGTNEYRVGARFYSGLAGPLTFFVDTLPQDRTRVSVWKPIANIFTDKWLLYSCLFLATQELFIELQTETSIAVHFTLLPGVSGSQLVARNWKLGRFLGTCDTQWGICRIGNLSSGYMYEIRVRTCSGSEPARCILRAMPVNIPTFPERKWLLTLWVWVFSTRNETCYFY